MEQQNKNNKFRIGVDLGGTNIKVGIVDINNNIIQTHSCDTLSNRSWQEVVDDIIKTVKITVDKSNITIEDCISCGIGCPGTINASNGVVIYSNNLKWENVPLGEYLSNALNLPVKVSNDANCAALGECVAGVAKEYKSAVLLTLGTGVGGGVVYDGKIFEGGAGGMELGHISLVDEGDECTCGRRGCIESYCSATALIRQSLKCIEIHSDTLMVKLMQENNNKMNAKIPFDAAKLNDKYALNLVNRYIEWLGKSIVNMINIFRPEVVLLSGGICAEGEYLTIPLTKYANKYSYAAGLVDKIPVKIAMLGNTAGILGAASL